MHIMKKITHDLNLYINVTYLIPLPNNLWSNSYVFVFHNLSQSSWIYVYSKGRDTETDKSFWWYTLNVPTARTGPGQEAEAQSRFSSGWQDLSHALTADSPHHEYPKDVVSPLRFAGSSDLSHPPWTITIHRAYPLYIQLRMPCHNSMFHIAEDISNCTYMGSLTHRNIPCLFSSIMQLR